MSTPLFKDDRLKETRVSRQGTGENKRWNLENLGGKKGERR